MPRAPLHALRVARPAAPLAVRWTALLAVAGVASYCTATAHAQQTPPVVDPNAPRWQPPPDSPPPGQQPPTQQHGPRVAPTGVPPQQGPQQPPTPQQHGPQQGPQQAPPSGLQPQGPGGLQQQGPQPHGPQQAPTQPHGPQQAPTQPHGPQQAPTQQHGPQQAPPGQGSAQQTPPGQGNAQQAPPGQGNAQQTPPGQGNAQQTPPQPQIAPPTGAHGPGQAPLAAPMSPQDQAGPQAPVPPPDQSSPPPTPPAPHIALPVVVVAWPDRSVAAPVNEAIRTAVVEALAPAARGRPTVALADPTRLPPVLACNADAACIGQKLAELQAIEGVLVHVTRRNRTAPIDVRVEVVDPVSGAPRHEPVTGQVPYAQEASPAAAIATIVQPLLGSMPAPPPPPPTLLVAVNVDGAQIMVDGHPFGESPAPPSEVPAGRHNVVVTRSGWATGNRMVNVADTGATRTDFDLDPSAETLSEIETGRVHDTGGGRTARGGGGGEEQPFYTRWYVIAGAAAVLVGIIVIVAAVAASGTDIGMPDGIGVPGIH